MNGKANPMAVQGMSATTFGTRGMEEQSRASLFAQMFAIGATLVIVVVAGLYLYLDRVEKDRFAAIWELRAERLADRFHATVQTLEIDIDVLARDPALRRYINSRRDEDRRDAERELLAAVTGWEAFAQVRYIDAEGWERIRVDRANGAPHAVPADELRYKGERPYFKSASLLPPKSLYLSQLDLNMEDGEIEVPWRPMIRVAAPEFDDTGSPAGILVVNVLADPLLKEFYEHRGDGRSPNQPMLLAEDGSWIFGAPREKLWGFMFGGKAGFHLDNPAAWNAIASADSGAYWDGDVLYSFATIWPNGEIALRSEAGGLGTSVVSPVAFWKVVHATTRTTVPFLTRAEFMAAIAAALLLVGVGAWLWSGASYHRRLAERSQRSALLRGRALLDRTDAAIYILDFDHKFLGVNQKYCGMLGKPEAELLGAHVLDSVPRQVRAAWEETIAPFLDDPYAEASDVEFSFDLGGERKYFLTNYFPLVDVDGEPNSRAFVAFDITELKRVQQSLVAAQEQAIDASQAKSRFLANMSHELRTPLSSIIGYAELLEEEAAEDGMERYRGDIQRIVESGRHLLSLINDILDLSKIEAGRLELSIDDTTVGAILDEVLSTAAPLAELNRNKLTVNCHVWELALRTDTTRLRQILLNLLSNAAKFTVDGEIALSCRVADEHSEPSIIFEVTDTGIGMTPETLENMFEEFNRGDASSSRRYEGTGLGLAISKRLVQLLGGGISVESEKDVGSRFTVRIPMSLGHEDGPRALPAIDLNSARPSRSQSKRPSSVLVIDDDADSRSLMTRYITSAGMQVVTASSGAEGIERARQIRPDAITLDVFMKGLNGWEVLRQLKEIPSLREIPVIMCTMCDDDLTAVSLGAVEHLTKPISRDKYLAAIRRHAPEPPGGVVLVIDDLAENRAIYTRRLAGLDVEVVEAENGRDAFEKLAAIERLRGVVLDLQMPEMDGFEFLRRFRQSPKWWAVPVFVVTAKDLTAAERETLSQSAQTVVCREGRPVGDVLNEIKADLDRRIGAVAEN